MLLFNLLGHILQFLFPLLQLLSGFGEVSFKSVVLFFVSERAKSELCYLLLHLLLHRSIELCKLVILLLDLLLEHFLRSINLRSKLDDVTFEFFILVPWLTFLLQLSLHSIANT